MARQYARLERIEHNEEISAKTHPEFWDRLRHGILLALAEEGTLGQTQYQRAWELLKQHREARP